MSMLVNPKLSKSYSTSLSIYKESKYSLSFFANCDLVIIGTSTLKLPISYFSSCFNNFA